MNDAITIDKLLEGIDKPFLVESNEKHDIIPYLKSIKNRHYYAKGDTLFEKKRDSVKVVGYVNDDIAYLHLKNGKSRAIGTVEYQK